MVCPIIWVEMVGPELGQVNEGQTLGKPKGIVGTIQSETLF
jgi:hypothetical protein